MLINGIDQRSSNAPLVRSTSVLGSTTGSASGNLADVLSATSESVRVELKSILPRDDGAPAPARTIEGVSEMIEEANKRATDLKIDVQYDDQNGVVVRIINRESGELVRQIPPEEMIRLRDHLESLKGLLFSQES